ncbi:Bardet-Biedl syndrome 7 protein-like isoform X2 [Aricia agestis]|nr:Bardet-Biedl syndrome 7 protein-like isoform X2 [Aricia agestis]
MCVLGSDLILCSGRTVTFYRDLREIYSYVCEDRVLDIAAFGTPNTNRVRLLVLIANKGAMILENGQQQKRTYVSSGPTRISTPPTLHTSELCAFYGAADGSIGLIFYEESQLKSTCLVEGRGLGSVMCIGWFISNVGTHLAVGRHDGSIQLYLLNNDNFHEKPQLKYTYFCGEPVTSVSGGCISSNEPEVLASTFSGRIFALRSRRFAPTSGMGNISQEALALRRSKLETEVARLEKQTANEREKYQRNTRSFSAGVSAPPLLDLQYELSGATQDSWQELKLISAVPLDVLFIYCMNKLDIQTDSAAVLSICPPQKKAEDLLATIRCQAGTKRLWLRIRIQILNNAVVTEGSKVFIYVLPAGVPRVARLIKLYLPILPHYFKHEVTEEENKRGPWCELRVTGSFSVAEMTSWLSELLPRELPRPTASVAFARSHSLLDTILICKYQRGEAVFKSDDISAICIIKDVISNNAVKKGKRVEICCDTPKLCCLNAFQRIQEKFVVEHKKKMEFELKKALMSLDLVKEENEPELCNDYLKILGSSGENSENCFDDYVGIVLKWYDDWFNLKANNAKKATAELREALTKCNIDEIEIIFNMDS